VIPRGASLWIMAFFSSLAIAAMVATPFWAKPITRPPYDWERDDDWEDWPWGRR